MFMIILFFLQIKYHLSLHWLVLMYLLIETLFFHLCSYSDILIEREVLMQKYIHLVQIVETEKISANQLRHQLEDQDTEIERLKSEVCPKIICIVITSFFPLLPEMINLFLKVFNFKQSIKTLINYSEARLILVPKEIYYIYCLGIILAFSTEEKLLGYFI